MAVPEIRTRPLKASDWTLVERLFGANGACGGCWCMLWRVPRGGRYWEGQLGEPNRRSLRSIISSGKATGCLAFADDQPVGWCSVGPKENFPYFQRSRVLNHDAPPGTWSLTCFYIPRRWRGKGVAGHLLDEAVLLARAGEASHVEGYPIVPKSADQPIPAAFAWTGVPTLFESAGFSRVKGRTGMRPIFRLALAQRVSV